MQTMADIDNPLSLCAFCVYPKCLSLYRVSPCLCRCVVTGLQALHNASYGHTDVRWENII